MIDPENAQGVQGTGLGLAPIGHQVTITTPTEIAINIETTIVLNNGYSLPQVESLIQQAIAEYLLSLRKAWGIGDDLNQYTLAVYIARINAAILSVNGVANVTNTLINGFAQDLVLEQSAATQELPQLGTVIINVQS